MICARSTASAYPRALPSVTASRQTAGPMSSSACSASIARIPALFVLMSPSASQTIFMPALYTCIQNYTIKLYPPQALSQSWLLEAKSANRLSENQLLASLNFPVFGDLRQSRPLSLTPMYVHRDEHATGLIRLLSIGLRVLTLLEYVVRRQLAAQGETLAGLYVGNAKRETARPTAERLLEVFQEVTLTVVEGATQIYRHLTA